MKITKKYNTNNKSMGINTCEYIILHHTATWEWTLRWLINAFTWQRKVSAHYLVDTDGLIYQFWTDRDILWHSGTSLWQWKTFLNRYSIWIEVIGPLRNWGFTDKQKESVEVIIQHLSQKYNIGVKNILRHKDISPRRKWDISDTFWNWKFKTFEEYKKSLFIKNKIMAKEPKKSKYTDIKDTVLQVTWLTPIFNAHEWLWTLTEQETKELIEIAGARIREEFYKSKI